jgi:hypothetical protein
LQGERGDDLAKTIGCGGRIDNRHRSWGVMVPLWFNIVLLASPWDFHLLLSLYVVVVILFVVFYYSKVPPNERDFRF